MLHLAEIEKDFQYPPLPVFSETFQSYCSIWVEFKGCGETLQNRSAKTNQSEWSDSHFLQYFWFALDLKYFIAFFYVTLRFKETAVSIMEWPKVWKIVEIVWFLKINNDV